MPDNFLSAVKVFDEQHGFICMFGQYKPMLFHFEKKACVVMI